MFAIIKVDKILYYKIAYKHEERTYNVKVTAGKIPIYLRHMEEGLNIDLMKHFLGYLEKKSKYR